MEQDRSGKQSEAGREWACEKTMEWEQSKEQTKLAPQILLKSDASLLKLRKLWFHVKIKLF